jgi:hypothetical protein
VSPFGSSVDGFDRTTRVAYGGKAIYGARVGILMLEARFPRIPGDMGNAETWPFSVLYRVVPGASPRRVVCDKAQGSSQNFSPPPTSSSASAPTASPRLAGSCRSTSARSQRMSACRSRHRA